jgi:hypothetical protein
MGDGDDHDLFVALRIDNDEGKTAKNRLSESPAHRRADSRTLSDRLNGAFHVVKKRFP